jgi:hypothetical protein
MLKARLKKDFVDERTTRLNQREESVQVSLVCIPQGSEVQLNWTGADLAEEGILGNICEIVYQDTVAYIDFDFLEVIGIMD